jgi:hypothetical protein
MADGVVADDVQLHAAAAMADMPDVVAGTTDLDEPVIAECPPGGLVVGFDSRVDALVTELELIHSPLAAI